MQGRGTTASHRQQVRPCVVSLRSAPVRPVTGAIDAAESFLVAGFIALPDCTAVGVAIAVPAPIPIVSIAVAAVAIDTKLAPVACVVFAS